MSASPWRARPAVVAQLRHGHNNGLSCVRCVGLARVVGTRRASQPNRAGCRQVGQSQRRPCGCVRDWSTRSATCDDIASRRGSRRLARQRAGQEPYRRPARRFPPSFADAGGARPSCMAISACTAGSDSPGQAECEPDGQLVDADGDADPDRQPPGRARSRSAAGSSSSSPRHIHSPTPTRTASAR